MKTSYYLSGLTLGVLVGVGIGYKIACNPRNRVKIRNFFNDVEDRIKGVEEKVKSIYKGQAEDLEEDDFSEIDIVLTE